MVARRQAREKRMEEVRQRRGRHASRLGWFAKGIRIPRIMPSLPRVPNKVDVVYPLGTESKWDDNELRYSLRSLEKNFPDLGRVFIVGHRPSWLTGVVHIAMGDVHKHNKDANLIDKILAACYSEVSDEFVFMSDDQIFLKSVKFKNMKPFHLGNLIAKGESFWKDGVWRRRLAATKDMLHRAGHTTYHYDSHCPTPYNKNAFVAAVTQFPYRKGSGFTINTLYCNAAGVNGEPLAERKKTYESAMTDDASTIRQSLQNKWYLGYNNAGLTDALKSVLAEMFPIASKFEIVSY
jgi:hypothetical protein